MQRRTAAIYVVFFVVVAIVAFSLITVAEEPGISISGQTYSGNSSINVSGETYTISVSDGSGQISTVNESARFTAALSDNTTLRFVNATYRPVPNGSTGGGATVTGGSPTGGTGTPEAVGTSVPTDDSDDSTLTSGLVRVVIANATNASGGNASAGNASTSNASAGNASGNATGANITTFTLREVIDVSALLTDDPSVANMTLSANGTQYVRFQNDTVVPLDTYLPPVSTRNVSVGESFPYNGNATRVVRVNSSAATLAWRGTLTNTQELTEGQNVTIGGTTYLVHFQTNNSVVLSQSFTAYQEEQQQVTDFHNRLLGLWGVIIISLFAAILIVGLAYLPVRG
jgi:hypothetical protein